ncbi:uncharacterized protein isoform X1 [Rhodnius prolixus]|uniref:Uncharacterized protein n=1 Tax=Rhodnius prolixus TaxID=13249 RepID=A0A4P6D8X8_RHOPR
MGNLTYLLLGLLMTLNSNTNAGVVTVLLESLFGTPLFFKEQSWNFDPDISSKRNPEFEAINGHRSVSLIERFGLGIDGKMAERQQTNEIRDKMNSDNVS